MIKSLPERISDLYNRTRGLERYSCQESDAYWEFAEELIEEERQRRGDPPKQETLKARALEASDG